MYKYIELYAIKFIYIYSETLNSDVIVAVNIFLFQSKKTAFSNISINITLYLLHKSV